MSARSPIVTKRKLTRARRRKQERRWRFLGAYAREVFRLRAAYPIPAESP